MPADVKKLVAAQQSANWVRWLAFAAAVLAAKGAVKAVSGVIETANDFGGAQRGALRELFRM
jgi:hypothetical protein